MKTTLGIFLLALILSCSFASAQDTLYIYKAGLVVAKNPVNGIDSVTFSKNYKTACQDADGNVYHTVTIGTQVWTLENLKTTKLNDGTPIPEVTNNTTWSTLSTSAYCKYTNDSINGAKYGKLYNWYAVNTGKLAPAGWHVPTQADWQLLYDYLTAHVSTYGPVYKALASTTDWSVGTTTDAIGADLTKNNSSGFTAVPAGNRSYIDGRFGSLGSQCEWWCSKEMDAGNALFISLLSDSTWSFISFISKKSGFSVRCIKD